MTAPTVLPARRPEPVPWTWAWARQEVAQRRSARVAAVAVGAGALATAGLLLVLGASPIAFAPLAAPLLVLAAALAVTSFRAFVLVLLVVRAGVDSLGGLGPATVNVAISLAFVLTGLVWLAGDVRAGSPRTRTAAPSLALLAAAALSLTTSADAAAGGVEWLRIASGLLMLELLQRLVRTGLHVRALLAAVLLSAVVPVAAGIIQAVTHQGAARIGGFERAVGTFRHPNPFAIYLVLVLVAALACYPHLSRRMRVLAAAVGAPALVCLLFTYTRTGWVGLLVAVVVIGVLQSRRLLVGLVVVVVAALVLAPSVATRLSDLGTTERASGATGNSLVWRYQYWQETIELAEGRPMTGLGLAMVRRTTDAEKQPHNDFVRTAAETGVLGLGAYLWLLAALVGTARAALRGTRGAGPDVRRGGAVALAAAVTAVLLMSVASNVLSQVVLLWYTAAVVGLAAPAARAGSRSRSGDVRREPAGVPPG